MTTLSASAEPASTPGPPPACSICGRQDETLRIVGYPFVVSLLIVTYQRALAGIWCGRHRNQRLAFSSLITATIGWLGIPFGFIYTPITLFKLARGGIQPADANAEMLRQIAASKLQRGDYQTALRCLEASLRFQDSEPARQQLRQIRSRYGITVEGAGCLSMILTFAAVLLGAGALGTAVGLVDYLIGVAASPLLKQATSLYVGILSWAPFVVMAFLAGLILFALVEWAVVRVRCKSAPVATTLGLIAGCFATYGLLEGMMIGDFVASLVVGTIFESTSEAIVIGLLTLVIGGALAIPEVVQPTRLSDTIYLVLLAAATLYYVGFAIARGVEAVRWQQRIVSPETTLTGLVRPATF